MHNMATKITTSKQLIFGKFKLVKEIGEGSFGKVYSGINIKTKEPVAIKLEPKSLPLNFLKSEAFYLFMLKGSFGYVRSETSREVPFSAYLETIRPSVDSAVIRSPLCSPVVISRSRIW